MGGAGLGGEAKLVQDGIHEVAGAIAGEGAAGAVGSMCAGGKTEDEDAGAWIAKAGNRAGPIGLVQVGAALGLADAAAVVAKARATFAVDDGFANLKEERRRTLSVGGVSLHPMIVVVERTRPLLPGLAASRRMLLAYCND